MKAIITPAPLRGSIAAIPSKSQAHRLLICAALADGPTRIACSSLSADIEATASCLQALGAEIDYSDGVFTVTPIKTPRPGAALDCGESGSTLRFLLPVVCALGGGATIKMHGRLPCRPLSPLWEELERCGARLSRPAEDVIAVSGALSENNFTIAADISSQYISGLLFALPILDGGSVTLTGKVESAGYIEMTLRALAQFGAAPEKQGTAYALAPGKTYASPGKARVEGDWSNAAFWVAAGTLSGGGLECTGLEPDSPQGDRAVVQAVEAIKKGGAVIDAADIPDLVPVLAALAALTPGRTEFINAGRLRIKESDRLATVHGMLSDLGADVAETADGLVVNGKPALPGGNTQSHGDHRIAMSAAVAAIGCVGEVSIDAAEAVNKSYPGFWRDYAALGGRLRLEEI